MSQTHTIRGQLHHVALDQRGGLYTITLTVQQRGRYTSGEVRCIRSYPAQEADRARRHYLRLTRQIDGQVYCDGEALVALPGGVTLLGVGRISVPTPAATAPAGAFLPTQPFVARKVVPSLEQMQRSLEGAAC